MWTYRARARRVIDGDTIEVVLDLGFHIEHVCRIRVEGLDTPEVRGPERPHGLEATAAAVAWFDAVEPGEWPLIVTTDKDRSFNRWVGRISDVDGNDFGSAMHAAGWHVER